jgi:glycosyltransferase involved in cell wall biosynthesis
MNQIMKGEPMTVLEAFKMRIAHVTATYFPHNTGTGNVAHHNAAEMARLGHDVTVFTALAERTSRFEVQDEVSVYRLKPLLRHGNALFMPGLFTRLRTFDLVHLHMPFYGAAETVYLLRKLTGIPLVITHHQDVLLRGVASAISRTHDRLIGRRLMQTADRACFTSLDYAYHSQFRPQIETGQVKPIEMPNGVDPATYSPGEQPSDLLERLNLQGRAVLLFVGALDRAHYFKGVHILLQALARVVRPDVALVIVGEGDLRAEYKQQSLDLGLQEWVRFTGFVDSQELVNFYRLADITLLPSTTAGEAFGLVLLESLACGTPVIAPNLPGVRTVVADPVDGRLVEPGSIDDLAGKLNALLSLPEEQRRAMGQAGRQRVTSRYDWRLIGARLEALYAEVLAERAASAQGKAELGV